MDWGLVIAVITGVSTFILGWTGKARTVKKDIASEVTAEAVQRADVEYIKRGVDDIRVDVRMQGQRLETVSERVTRVEESSKQAHKRLDRLENIEGRG
ncbi:hypothetical protein [Paenibacillus aceti]|uniref:DUF948 domain-containing protein n=1 Tax=Paenibacillus aceti TaxID=1820010 RepID=A0ABQ1VPN9_9BACL|nr:hypothetical protein [Paenibacillus aceti]GGF87015.1 hypothetical protein GCM10010913_05620 [Paenibacillus aceti]